MKTSESLGAREPAKKSAQSSVRFGLYRVLRKLILASPFVLILPGAPAWAASAGTTAANFLDFGQGPRAVGMGESQVAAANDAYSAYWNPAGLAAMRYSQLALTYNKALEGVDQQYLSLAYPLRAGQTIGLDLTRLGMSSFQGYDAQGGQTGGVTADDLAVGAAWGQTLLRDESSRPLIDGGVHVKYIRERLASAQAQTFAGDLGAIYHLHTSLDSGLYPDSGFRLGFAAKNVGQALRYDNLAFDLPAAYQIGAAWKGYPNGDALTFSLDEAMSKEEGMYTAFGAEYVVSRLLALRMGYRTGQDIGIGFRGGVGFQMKPFNIDYAFSAFGDLGQMHRVGLSMRFGGPVEVTPPDESAIRGLLEKGHHLSREGRYYDAILEYDKILMFDPGNKEALEWMKRANEKLQK